MRARTEGPRLLSRELIITCTTGFFQILGFGLTMPLLSRYVENELGGGGVAVGITFGSFSISAILLRPWLGALGDRHGRRILILLGGVLVGLGTATHVFASSVTILVLGRLIVGAGQASFFVGAATLVVDLAPPDRRGEATSYFSVAVFLGGGLGPLAGEAMLDASGFEAAFLLGASFAMISGLVALLLPERVPVSDERPVRIDTPARGAPPALYRQSIPPGIALFLGLVSYTAFSGFLPLRAEELGIDNIAIFFMFQAVVVIIVRLRWATLPDRLGTVATGTIALSAAAAGMLLMGFAGSMAGLLVATGVWGVGVSLLYPAMLIAAVDGVPDDERASAMGTFTLFFDLAGGIGGLALGLAKAGGSNQTPFFVAGVSGLIGLVALRTWVASALRDAPGQPPTLPKSIG